MKRFTLLLLALLSHPLFAENAENGEWLIGLDAGATGLVMTEAAVNERNYTPEYGLKIGLQEENSRVYIGVTYANNIGSDVNKTLNPYIALEGVSDAFKVIAKSKAKFYFGARLGASIADINGATKTAALTGLQTGLIFLLPADLEIELAYRHYWTFKDTATNFNGGALYGALNYKFYAF